MQKFFFVTKHRLNVQIGAKACINVYAMCTHSLLSFHFAYHRCWLGVLHCCVLPYKLKFTLSFPFRKKGEGRGGVGRNAGFLMSSVVRGADAMALWPSGDDDDDAVGMEGKREERRERERERKNLIC